MILRADARRLPLPDGSVDLLVTSPPYYALRSYTDGGEHYEGQIGSEKTPAEYVDNLIACTREWMRVLKPSGSLWVNMGDKYAAGHGGSSTEGNGVNINVGHRAEPNFRDRPDLPNPPASWGKRDAGGRAIVPGFRPKTLMGMPWRYALRCIDDLGLILRAEVIWSKPNGLPESVTDRVRRSHEQWFHFVRSPRYYSAVDTIRQPHTWGRQINPAWAESRKDWGQGSQGRPQKNDGFASLNPLGALPGSVWEIPTQPLKVPAHLDVDHFAAFPMEWPRRIIQGWSPSGVCTGCGEGRRPAVEVGAERASNGQRLLGGDATSAYGTRPDERRVRTATGYAFPSKERAITGERCACPDTSAPTRPAVVLDPFGGTGTTALVAAVLGRTGISVDMSADYCRLAQWRTTDPGQIAAAMQVEKPPVQLEGQDDLLDLLGLP